MKLHVKIQLLKFCSSLFNGIFLALGLSVTGCAIWILFDNGNFITAISLDNLKIVGGVLFLTGVVVVMGSVVGWIGTHWENRHLLFIYLGFLLVLVLGQLFVLLLLVFNKQQIEKSLYTVVDKTIVQYNNSNILDSLLDSMQHYGKCCGRISRSDWLNNYMLKKLNMTDVLPCSCFHTYNRTSVSPWCSELLNITGLPVGHGVNSFHQGCEDMLSNWLHENIVTIVGMDVSLIVIQVLQTILAVSLYQSLRQAAALKRKNMVDDPDSAPISDQGEENQAYTDTDD